jgi:hypothetical protein
MLGPAEYQPIVAGYRQKLRSFTALNEQLASKPSRKTPKYLRIIAAPDANQQWESEPQGDVGALRWGLVEEYLGSIAQFLITGSSSVA